MTDKKETLKCTDEEIDTVRDMIADFFGHLSDREIEIAIEIIVSAYIEGYKIEPYDIDDEPEEEPEND